MKKLILIIIVALTLTPLSGCRVSYSTTNASLPSNLESATVMYFPNMAMMVAPSLAPTFNDELAQKIQRESRLRMVRDGGDVVFEGQIIDYRSDPVATTADGFASKNRLTITVKVKFTDNKNSKTFEKTFSEMEEYDSSKMLIAVEPELIPIIVGKLINNIFNEAFSNW